MKSTFLVAAAFVAAVAGGTLPSRAVTIGFDAKVDPYVEDGFQFDVAHIVNGNCFDNPCMALNKTETSVLTRVGGGSFSLSSFWFEILGNPAILTVRSYGGVDLREEFNLSEAVYPHNNKGQVFSHLFDNVTSIVFLNAGAGNLLDGCKKPKGKSKPVDCSAGNLRIDEINVSTPTVSAVPLPAGLPLLVSGLFGLGLLKRRRDKAQA